MGSYRLADEVVFFVAWGKCLCSGFVVVLKWIVRVSF